MYVGFKGTNTKIKREVIKGVVYEARALPEDHKSKAGGDGMSRDIA